MAQISSSYVFRLLTTGDGLASNRVTGILRDEKGFMWMSTYDGLQRYDGYSFSTWHHHPDDSSSLSSDGSVCLLKDPDNNLWLSSWPRGFAVFNPRSGKCRGIFGSNLTNQQGACLYKDSNVWLVSSASLEEYERSTRRLISLDSLLPPGIDFHSGIFHDPFTDDIYLNSYRFGICLFRRSEKKLYYRLYNPRHIPLLDLGKAIGTIFVDRDHCFWLYTYSGTVFRADPAFRKIIPCTFQDPAQPRGRKPIFRINSIIQDRQGTLWFTSDLGLLHCSYGASTLQVIRENTDDPNGLHSNGQINCLTEDPEGNIWVGTNGGINIFNPGLRKFVSIPIASSPSPANRKFSIINFGERDNGDIWVGTYGGGIFVLDRNLQF